MTTDWADDLPDGLIAIRAHVWGCSDDCDCTQARIEGAFGSTPSGRPRFTVTLWSGTFVSGWPYEYDTDEWVRGGPTTELNREARRLRKHHNELFHRIEWPWDRSRKAAEERERKAAVERDRAAAAALAVARAAEHSQRAEAGRELFVSSMRELFPPDEAPGS